MKIGTQNEKPLHAALKVWYAQPEDQVEVEVDGYVVDILQGDSLVEIQTGNFSAIKLKITDLVQRYPIRLVYPVPQEKWIVKVPPEGKGQTTRRKSPRQGRVVDVFKELVSFPELMLQPNFSLELLLIQEEEVREYIGRRRWRKKGWGIRERRLLGILARDVFEGPADFRKLIPPGLPEQFTTQDLAAGMGEPRWLAQKAAYCYQKMDLIDQIGKRGRSNLYRRNPSGWSGSCLNAFIDF